MKKHAHTFLTIIILAAGAYVLADTPAPKLDGTAKLTISGTTKASDMRITSVSSLIIMDQVDHAEAFRLTGLTAIELGDPSPYQGMRYGRPEKPEEVVAYLWTKDGRKWRAQWLEVKP